MERRAARALDNLENFLLEDALEGADLAQDAAHFACPH